MASSELPTQPVSVPSLNEHIRRLTDMTASRVPVLSWYLQPDGLDWYLRFDARLRQARPSQMAGAFDAALARATALLHRSLAESTRGAAVFVREGRDPFFLLLQFKVPITEALVFAERPYLYPLFEVRDAYDHFLTVVVWPGGTEFVDVHVGEPQPGAIWLEHGSPLSARRNHESTVAALERMLARRGGRFVVAGPASLVGGLCEALPTVLGQRLAATVHVPRHTSLPRLLKGALDAFVHWERAKSSAAVVQLRQLLEHGRAVAGVEGTLEALARRQVDTLVMSKAFDSRDASICPACGYLEPRNGSTPCPRCGVRRAVRDTREALLALAERQGSDVELVDPHPLLHHLGRVGAMLRYPWSETRVRLAS